MTFNKTIEASLTRAPVDATARIVTSQAGCTDTSPEATIASLYAQKEVLRLQAVELARELGITDDLYKGLTRFKPADRTQLDKASRLAVILASIPGITQRICEVTGAVRLKTTTKRSRSLARRLSFGHSNVSDIKDGSVTGTYRADFYRLAGTVPQGSALDGVYTGFVSSVIKRSVNVYIVTCILMSDASGNVPLGWRATGYFLHVAPSKQNLNKLCQITIEAGVVSAIAGHPYAVFKNAYAP